MCPLGKLEISLGGVAVRKSVVRKPGPAAAVGALFSRIMREQSSRKATPCGPGCRGSKLPLLGRILQGKHEFSLSQHRFWFGEDKVAGDLLVGMSLEDAWQPQSWEKSGQCCRGCHVLGTRVPGGHTGMGAIRHMWTGLQGHLVDGTQDDKFSVASVVGSLSCSSTAGTSSWGHPGIWIPVGHVDVTSVVVSLRYSSTAGTPCPGDILGHRSL